MNLRSYCRLGAAVIGFTTMTSLATSALTNNVVPVQQVILDNGLTVLVREDRSAPVVTAQAWCKAGSITEGRWLGAGLSHVLEHMLFKGTTTRGVAEIAQQIEDKGGYINAYTSFEHTVYYINLPAANWTTAVDILADCMINATIPAEELAKEKDVILREMAMNVDDPDRRADRLLWATAYLEHPYRHPVIGYPDVFNRLTREDVLAYYRRYYVPNNLVFAIVGNVRATEVIERLRELTKDFRRAPLEPTFIPPEPPQLSLRQHHEQAAVNLTRLNLAWHIPNFSHPDAYALDVLAIIAGNGRSSRLYRQIRQAKGLVHSIQCGAYTPTYPGIFGVEATTDPDKRDAAIAAIREELARFRDEPVSAAELQKAIKMLLSGHLAKFKTMEGQAADLANSFILTGDPNFSDVYLENIRQVRPEDIQRVATRYFTEANLTITSLNPESRSGVQTVAAATNTAVEVQKFVLPNGLRLLVREDPRLPFVDLRVLCQGGVLVETATNNGITKLMSRMLLKGTQTRSADQIAETIEAVGGDISYFAGNNSFGVSAHLLAEDTQLGLEVLSDVVRNPAFPAALLERERAVQLAEIKAEQDQIMRAGQQLLREALFQTHPYRFNQLGSPATVARLTAADLAAFHRQFMSPSNMVITVFGQVSATQIRKQIEAAFGSMPPVREALPDPRPERLAQSVRQVAHLPKEQAVLLLGFSGAAVDSPDRFALELLNEAYSAQGSRLFLRIRDELGLAYYVGAYQLLGLDPGYFAFYAGLEPSKVKTCEQELAAELDKLRREGLSPAELERAKNSLLGQRHVRMQDNAELSMTIGLDELYGLGHEYFKTIEAKYQAVTTADIQRVANQYLVGRPRATIIVEPTPTP